MKRKYGDEPEPKPPARYSADAGRHWLEVKDSDGHSFGYVILQWQPFARRWCHSGDVATGINVDTSAWRYVEPVKPREAV